MTFYSTFLTTALIVAGSMACTNTESKEENTEMSTKFIEVADYGVLPDSSKAQLFTLKNAQGMTVKITNYGGIITSLTAPDKDGKYGEVTLGCNTLEDYLKGTPFFGALVGRYGNRIANGEFTLEGKKYTLEKNNGVNALHGGKKGFDKVLWTAVPVDGEEPQLKLSYTSKDMEEGYPGNLKVQVTYTLQKDNSLKIDYSATTDKTTVVNLTNHTYFNLAGDDSRDVLDHEVTLKADKFTPVNSSLIPTGELKDVKGTPFDFTTAHKIGERINDESDDQIKAGGGYDHCWVLNESSTPLKTFATVTEATSGRVMEVSTTEPGVQFYTGNFLNGSVIGRNGKPYTKRSGFCLETQHFPDSPNQPKFPSTTLKPNEVYKTTTIYKFSVK
ncbi:galactose-1-epimerase [Emticicia sp. CRIBPO]|nr:galactose-1-epimerase [Emticicia sp. CRIBPO]